MKELIMKVSAPIILIILTIASIPVIYILTEPVPTAAPRAKIVDPQQTSSLPTPGSPASNSETAEISIFPNGPTQQVILVPAAYDQQRYAALGQMARDAGFQCDTINAIYSLTDTQRNDLPIYKIDCSEGISIQVTDYNGRTFLKPWTGAMLKP